MQAPIREEKQLKLRKRLFIKNALAAVIGTDEKL